MDVTEALWTLQGHGGPEFAAVYAEIERLTARVAELEAERGEPSPRTAQCAADQGEACTCRSDEACLLDVCPDSACHAMALGPWRPA